MKKKYKNFTPTPGFNYSPAETVISPVDGKEYTFPPRRDPTTESLLWKKLKPYYLGESDHYYIFGPLRLVKVAIDEFFAADPSLLCWEADYQFPINEFYYDRNKGMCQLQWYEDGIHHIEGFAYLIDPDLDTTDIYKDYNIDDDDDDFYPIAHIGHKYL